MARMNAKVKPRRLVWRISDAAPLGEWVDLNNPPVKVKTPVAVEASTRNWIGSSFDLLNGVDINEDQDTVPDSLRDEFFPPDSADRKPPDK